MSKPIDVDRVDAWPLVEALRCLIRELEDFRDLLPDSLDNSSVASKIEATHAVNQGFAVVEIALLHLGFEPLQPFAAELRGNRRVRAAIHAVLDVMSQVSKGLGLIRVTPLTREGLDDIRKRCLKAVELLLRELPPRKQKPAPKRRKRRAGAPGYPAKVRQFVANLAKKYPDWTHKQVRDKCVEKFGKDAVSASLSAFSRWHNRLLEKLRDK
jgi:hypothetical protein